MLAWILTRVEHVEVPDGYKYSKHFDALGQICSLFRHFRVWTEDKVASKY